MVSFILTFYGNNSILCKYYQVKKNSLLKAHDLREYQFAITAIPQKTAINTWGGKIQISYF
jgi:hypothetical protein